MRKARMIGAWIRTRLTGTTRIPAFLSGSTSDRPRPSRSRDLIHTPTPAAAARPFHLHIIFSKLSYLRRIFRIPRARIFPVARLPFPFLGLLGAMAFALCAWVAFFGVRGWACVGGTAHVWNGKVSLYLAAWRAGERLVGRQAD